MGKSGGHYLIPWWLSMESYEKEAGMGFTRKLWNFIKIHFLCLSVYTLIHHNFEGHSVSLFILKLMNLWPIWNGIMPKNLNWFIKIMKEMIQNVQLHFFFACLYMNLSLFFYLKTEHIEMSPLYNHSYREKEKLNIT